MRFIQRQRTGVRGNLHRRPAYQVPRRVRRPVRKDALSAEKVIHSETQGRDGTVSEGVVLGWNQEVGI